jgi:8-oxo-dGTP diphosphatase
MIRVAAGILSRDGRILICRRTGQDAFAGKWEFPGGKLRKGESPEEALVRELEEELDILVAGESLQWIETVRHTYANGPRVELHFFGVLRFEGEPVNRCFGAMEWVPPSRMEEFDFLEADRPLVRRLAAGGLPSGR